jgi:hypothetical protein
MERVGERLKVLIPVTLLLIALLLYWNTRSLAKTSLILLAAPFSAVGAIWLLAALGYNLMIGGIATSFLLELAVCPALYAVWRWHSKKARIESLAAQRDPRAAMEPVIAEPTPEVRCRIERVHLSRVDTRCGGVLLGGRATLCSNKSGATGADVAPAPFAQKRLNYCEAGGHSLAWYFSSTIREEVPGGSTCRVLRNSISESWSYSLALQKAVRV